MPRKRDENDDEDRDEEEDRPRSRRRRDEEDEEDEQEDRPRRKRRRDDDEEDDERRSVQKKGRLGRDTLRSIAIYQKILLLCILFYVIAVVTGIFLPQEIKWVTGLIGVPTVLTAVVFVFLLSTKVFNVGLGVLLAILTLIPCIGLIVLLIINITATSTLKANGIHVGFLGASMSDLE